MIVLPHEDRMWQGETIDRKLRTPESSRSFLGCGIPTGLAEQYVAFLGNAYARMNPHGKVVLAGTVPCATSTWRKERVDAGTRCGSPVETTRCPKTVMLDKSVKSYSQSKAAHTRVACCGDETSFAFCQGLGWTVGIGRPSNTE